ncbi:MAG: radical SAM protein [Candidatus Omnitrophica bacterium]|nr:radical SAM protein [Candidatus Omnitrophota bacterium]MDD5553110.1 radical SAM protein [Candidatus Omnitrophota bacterium]
MRILLSSVCLETGTDIQLALYYLKGYLLKAKPSYGVTIQVFNENLKTPAITEKILEFKPRLIGFSCYLWNIKKILNICRRLKKIDPELKIVLGGPEVSPRAEEILADEKAIDAVVRGEGEKTFAQLALRMGRSIPADLSGIRGVSFRKGAEIIRNPDRPLLRNAGDIPSPYLSGLINLKDKNILDVPLETTRGCSSRCHYCYYHKNFPAVRRFSLGRIEKELKLILSHKPQEVYLMDATFNSDPQRAKEILKIFIRNNQGANLHVELKAELIDEEMARLLSKANAYNIEIGIQSANPKTLKAVNRGFNKKRFIKGIRYLNTFKLFYEIQLIDALPYQSYDNLMSSLNWLYSMHPAKVVILRLNLLPGTTLRDRAAGFGIEFDHRAPYYAYKSNAMTDTQVKSVEKLTYAMDRLYDSQVFQKTLYAFKAKAGVKITTILEDWVAWESKFKRRPEDYPEFLNRKSPMFLSYLCRKHSKTDLYKELLPGLLKGLCFTYNK